MKLTSKILKQMIRESLATVLPSDMNAPASDIERKMDAVAAEVEDMMTKDSDDIVAELTNILTTFRPHAKVEDLAREAYSLLVSFGYQDPRTDRFVKWKEQMEAEKRENDEFGMEMPDDLGRDLD